MPESKPFQRSIIQELVEQRKIYENQIYQVREVQEIDIQEFSRYERLLDLLREEAIYHLNIAVRSGKGKTKKLSPESLNLTKAQENAIKANAGRLGSIQVFKPMEVVSYKIHYQRAKIMRKTIDLGGVPVVPESKIQEVLSEIRELQELIEASKKQISEEYNLGFRDFLYRVTNIINESNVQDDLYKGIIEEYSRAFPTLGSILDQMHVIINGPYRIPSLLEDEYHDQHFLAQEMKTKMLKDVKDSFAKLKNALFNSLLECLSDIEEKASKNTIASRKEAKRLLQKVEKLTQKSSSIIEETILEDDTEDLVTLRLMLQPLEYYEDTENIQHQIDRIRDRFKLKASPQKEGTTFEESIMENLDLSF